MPDDIGPATEAFRLHTSDGVSLEAELRTAPAGPTPIGRVVLAHPHPQFGGSMRSLVTSELFRTLPDHGITTLRFNFRGVEGSEGTYGEGRAEHADVMAAIDALAARSAESTTPLVLCGWSFGADVSLSVIDERLAGWFLIAPPLRLLRPEEFVAASDPRPKVLAVPEHDQYSSPECTREVTATWTNADVEVIAGGDHFLAGRTTVAADLLVEFVKSVESLNN